MTWLEKEYVMRYLGKLIRERMCYYRFKKKLKKRKNLLLKISKFNLIRERICY